MKPACTSVLVIVLLLVNLALHFANASPVKMHPTFLLHRTITQGSHQVTAEMGMWHGKGHRLWLVTFSNAKCDKVRRDIEHMGVRVLEYIPERTFLCLIPVRFSLHRISGKPWLIRLNRLEPQDKLANSLTLSKGTPAASIHHLDITTLSSYASTEFKNRLSGLSWRIIEQDKGSTFHRWRIFSTKQIEKEQILQLAALPSVYFIERTPHYEPGNADAAWVIQSNNGTVPEELPLWSAGLTGAGQIAAVCDTGVDVTVCQFYDSTQGMPTSTPNYNQRKVVAYYDWVGNGDGDADSWTHGTHVAGTIGADDPADSGTRFTDFPEFDDADGMGRFTKLVVQDTGDGGVLSGIPLNLTPLFDQAYLAGARFHSNSWGQTTIHDYTSNSRELDEFVWNHRDFLVVFLAGNGNMQAQSIWAPSTAKNCVSVGATWNGSEANAIYAASSVGPAVDGRLKPTIMAPGVNVFSAIGLNHSYGQGNGCEGYWSSGTSMATPVITGNATLLREYFMTGFYPTGTALQSHGFTPSAALLKAVLINAGQPVQWIKQWDGSQWVLTPAQPIFSNEQGWGRPLLKNVLSFSGNPGRLRVFDMPSGLAEGESITFEIATLASTDDLTFTLVWTDYPSSVLSSINLVNDLNLQVLTPTSSVYLGNQFSNNYSVSGGRADNRNVEEEVRLSQSEAGVYKVTISTGTVPSGPQPFALVVSGALNRAGGWLTCDDSRYPANGTVTLQLYDINVPKAGTVTVHLSSPTDSTGEEVSLTEISAGSGYYSGSIQLMPSSTSFDNDGILQVQVGEQITATYADANNGFGNPESFTSMAFVDQPSAAVPVFDVFGMILLLVVISLLLTHRLRGAAGAEKRIAI